MAVFLTQGGQRTEKLLFCNAFPPKVTFKGLSYIFVHFSSWISLSKELHVGQLQYILCLFSSRGRHRSGRKEEEEELDFFFLIASSSTTSFPLVSTPHPPAEEEKGEKGSVDGGQGMVGVVIYFYCLVLFIQNMLIYKYFFALYQLYSTTRQKKFLIQILLSLLQKSERRRTQKGVRYFIFSFSPCVGAGARTSVSLFSPPREKKTRGKKLFVMWVTYCADRVGGKQTDGGRRTQLLMSLRKSGVRLHFVCALLLVFQYFEG